MRREEDFPPPSGGALWVAIAALIVVVAFILTGLAYGLAEFAHAVRMAIRAIG